MSDLDDDRSRSLLNKADEFLRRRELLGSGLMGGQSPAAETDDIPLLTDVVNGDLVAADTAVTATQKDLNAEISREILAWLDENLPQVVVHALDGISDRLIAQIHENARTDLLPRLKRALSDDPRRDEN